MKRDPNSFGKQPKNKERKYRYDDESYPSKKELQQQYKRKQKYKKLDNWED